ncbi:MAG: sugar ABC transporter substrate-binding protein, partial [Chloroflexi bacterium]|nr:sugar ABC transporter substrate-binding protein [Chloroflexota bacterium]
MRLPAYFMICVLLTLAVGPLTSAQDDPTPTPFPPLDVCPLDDGSFTIAWIPKALNNQVFELGRIGAETRAAELTEEGPCTVEILYAAPLTASAEDQAALLDEVMDLGTVDAIGLSCIDPDICVDPIQKALDLGIAVMTWDSDSPESGRLTYLGIDNYKGGQAAGDLLVRAMGESGQVAIMSGVPGSVNLEQRIDGFRDFIADYPDIEIVDIVYSDDLPTRAVELIEAVMRAHPELDGWFFVGLWPLFAGRGAMPLWEQAAMEDGLVTIAFDTLPLILEFMSEGFLQG